MWQEHQDFVFSFMMDLWGVLEIMDRFRPFFFWVFRNVKLYNLNKTWTENNKICGNYHGLNKFWGVWSRGSSRSYGPILPIHELDLTFSKIRLETKFYQSSSKITQVIALTDRRTDGRTDGQTDRRTSLNRIFFRFYEYVSKKPIVGNDYSNALHFYTNP